MAIVLATALAVTGLASILPGLGVLSMAAALLAPTIAPVLALLSLTLVAIGFFALRRGMRRGGTAAMALGGIGALSHAAVTASLVVAVVSAGGSVNLLTATFGLSAMGAAKPDKTVAFDATSSGEQLSLSIYEPNGADGPAPTIMFVHGGGWISRAPDTLSTELRSLADDGYLVVSVEYELATQANPTWQSAPAQVACAASWISENADSIGADLNRLAFWGESAGGNLVINTAGAAARGTAVSSCGGKAPVPAAVVTDFPAVNVTSVFNNPFDVAGISTRNFATSFTGGSPSQYPDRYSAANSATYLSANTPKTLVMTPTRDNLIRPEDQYDWAKSARELGVSVDVVKIPFANHAYPQFAGNSLGSQAHLSIAKAYLAKQLN